MNANNTEPSYCAAMGRLTDILISKARNAHELAQITKALLDLNATIHKHVQEIVTSSLESTFEDIRRSKLK